MSLAAMFLVVAIIGDDGPIGLADWPTYRAALGRKMGTDEPIRPVTFRDLWDHPETYRGQVVEAAGRVVRLFRQPPVGEFPALVEIWIFDSGNNPTCVVLPDSKDAPPPKVGDSIRAVGTYLRRVRYPAVDVDRLAPLIVGRGPAAIVTQPSAAQPEAAGGWGSEAFVVVVVVGSVVAVALLRVHGRRPLPRPIVEGPPPDFIDSPPKDDAG